MKLIKRLLPMAMVGALSLPIIANATSCSKDSGLQSLELTFDDDFQIGYDVGDELNLDGLHVFAKYKNGEQKEVDVADCSITPSLTKELTTDDKEVTVQYQGATAKFDIYVYQSTIAFDTDTIKRLEPATPTKVYTKTEVADIYFGTSNDSNNPIANDVLGHISDYAKIAELALIVEQRTKELAPIVQQTISFLINLLLGGSVANFIGVLNNSHIEVKDVAATHTASTEEAELSAKVNVSINSQLVDRTDPTNPQFLDPTNNYFLGVANITLTKIPYCMAYWQMAGQDKPYFGLAIKTNKLETSTDWQIKIEFNGTGHFGDRQETLTWTKELEYSKAKPFSETIKSQMIDFLQYQSFYLDKLKGTN